MLTAKRVNSLLHYNKTTGVFTWKVNRGGATKAGTIAGSIGTNSNGKKYVIIGIDYKTYFAHRIAFLAVTGALPLFDIDHVDGNGTNNKWENLREVSHLDNQRNMRKRVDNSSGVTGVVWRKATNRWVAQVRMNGKMINLGSFVQFDDAVKARADANERIGFHCSHGTERPL